MIDGAVARQSRGGRSIVDSSRGWQRSRFLFGFLCGPDKLTQTDFPTTRWQRRSSDQNEVVDSKTKMTSAISLSPSTAVHATFSSAIHSPTLIHSTSPTAVGSPAISTSAIHSPTLIHSTSSSPLQSCLESSYRILWKCRSSGTKILLIFGQPECI